MTDANVFLVALCAWRENRHGQISGMQSVVNCIVNRMAARKQDAYTVVTAYEQFSSMTAPKDPQLGLYPKENDPLWMLAQQLAAEGLEGTLPDITGGATSYYALTIAPPYWAPTMTPTTIVAGQQFMK